MEHEAGIEWVTGQGWDLGVDGDLGVSLDLGTNRVRQGAQGQMEGCWRCDGNRMDFGTEGVVEDDGVGWTCQRSISD